MVVLNSCLKLLEIQSGIEIGQSANSNEGIDIDIADACGLRCYIWRGDLCAFIMESTQCHSGE